MKETCDYFKLSIFSNKQSLKEQIIAQIQKQILLLPKLNSLPWPIIVPCPLNRSCYLLFLNVCLGSSESVKVKVFDIYLSGF